MITGSPPIQREINAENENSSQICVRDSTLERLKVLNRRVQSALMIRCPRLLCVNEMEIGT